MPVRCSVLRPSGLPFLMAPFRLCLDSTSCSLPLLTKAHFSYLGQLVQFSQPGRWGHGMGHPRGHNPALGFRDLCKKTGAIES